MAGSGLEVYLWNTPAVMCCTNNKFGSAGVLRIVSLGMVWIMQQLICSKPRSNAQFLTTIYFLHCGSFMRWIFVAIKTIVPAAIFRGLQWHGIMALRCSKIELAGPSPRMNFIVYLRDELGRWLKAVQNR
ncbi:hypothetical protein TNCV_755401 [Trichonephila clavipes]|nr:hypothetical protein TNCV_755401 [Trichonephila clavipes]